MDIVNEEQESEQLVEEKPSMTRVEAEKQGLIKFLLPKPKVEKDTKVKQGKKEVKFADDMDIDTDKSSKKASLNNNSSVQQNGGDSAKVEKEANKDKMELGKKPGPSFSSSLAKAARLARPAEAPKPDPYAGEPVYSPPTNPEASNGGSGKSVGVEIKAEEVCEESKVADDDETSG